MLDGYLKVVKEIKDANPRNIHWTTTLHSTFHYGHLGIFDLILNKISEIEPRDELGWTPLHLASKSGLLKVY